MQITSLWLEDVCIEICLSLLVRCPNLTDFHCSVARLGPRGAVGHKAGNSIPIQHLERLTWAYHPHPQYVDVFPYLRFPALQSLIWYSPYSGPPTTFDSEEASTLQMLIMNLPPTLSRLEFHGVKWWPKPFIYDLFSHTPGVRQLHLSGCECAFIMGVLSSLVRSHFPSEQKVQLPSLQDMIILNPSAGQMRFAALEAQMASGISRLFSLPKREARRNISIQLASNKRWGGEMYKVYWKLRRSGFLFLIWADAEMTRSLEAKIMEERLLRRGMLKDKGSLRWR
ncbi:hypothetical protein P691DRAFT_803337 [Macrolepiota fuliginosa MF-IS2]|uniref:Uncharacterized protein n=1 Tax=Macrolepiota fuliginosa MF-IS2 TaxID=1400762 RepID=A0A9P6C0Q3_9AGAR|nr:hypothetical protein P691DRAFT_803337 [Macrolepiota fuliginosa MF-IS2]